MATHTSRSRDLEDKMGKLKFEDVKLYIEQQGHMLLSSEYIGAHTKMNIKCPQGHYYKAHWNSFQQGHRCPYCAGQVVTYEDVKKHIESLGYLLLSESYENSGFYLKIRCNRGHEYQVKWSIIERGNRCPHCSKNRKITQEEVEGFIFSQGYKLLSTYKNNYTKLDIECNQGHQYKVAWRTFKSQKARCPFCAGNMKLTIEYVRKQIENDGYVLLSKEYENSYSKMNVQCDKGHKYWVNWSDFRTGNRCPQCRQSKGERFLQQLLPTLFPNTNIISQSNMEVLEKQTVDFYIPTLKLAIEYDGIQHFQPTCYGGMSEERAKKEFKKLQKRDKKKNKICKQVGVTLIRIPYHIPFEDIENTIKDRIGIA